MSFRKYWICGVASHKNVNVFNMARPLVPQKMLYALFIPLIAIVPLILFGQAPTPATNNPQSGTVTLDVASVRAGENLKVHVELDRATDLPNGYMSVQVAGPPPESVLSGNSVETAADKRVYDIDVLIPPDAPGGTWHIDSVFVGSHSGMHRTQIKIEKQKLS
jgi:hypothetical protein